MYAFGYNELATLGLGHVGRVVAKPVPTLPQWVGVKQVVASASHTAGFFEDGHAEVVGGNRYGAGCCGDKEFIKLQPVRCQLPTLSVFSLEESHGLALDLLGAPITWGGNIFGQLGIGTWSNGAELLKYPGCIASACFPQVPGPLVAVGGGQYFDLAIDVLGDLVVWGRDDKGQLGDGGPKVKLTPAVVSLANPATAIAGGGSHSLVLHADGSVSGMGNTRQGQLGTTVGVWTRPKLLNIENVCAIAAGGQYSLFLHRDGSVTQMGGELPPVTLKAPPCTAISQGTKHALLVCEGEVWAVGANEWGQLGDGTREAKATPVPIGIPATEVSAGVGHSIAR